MLTRTHKIVISVAAVLFSLLLGEVALRTYQYIFRGEAYFSFIPGKRDARFRMSPFLVFGPRIDWQIPGKQRPETSYFNKQGFRTKEIIGPKKPGEFRIIALGGSTTEDLWNEEGIHWPFVLERKLHEKGYSNVKVLNAGMSAYSTAHTLVRIALDIPEFKPDMILVMHNINDLTVNYFAAVHKQVVDPNYLVKYGTKRYTGEIGEDDVVLSRFVHFIRIRTNDLLFRRESHVRPGFDLSPGVRIFRRNLMNIIKLSSSQGIQLVLVTEPFCRSRDIFENTHNLAVRNFTDYLPNYEEFLLGMEMYNKVIIDVSKEGRVDLIDMATDFGSDKLLFADPVHYTSKGSELFGRKIANHIERILPHSVLHTGMPE